MTDHDPTEITALLHAARAGDESARNRLHERVYDELRRVAGRQIRGPVGADGLAPTALVHECFLRLAERDLDCRDRRHFFGLAARAMRDILVEDYRRRTAKKRGGDRQHVNLDHAEPAAEDDGTDPTVLGDALERLAATDPIASEVVMLRFFGGLTHEQVADLLELPVIRVRREWDYAKAWLQRTIDSSS